MIQSAETVSQQEFTEQPTRENTQYLERDSIEEFDTQSQSRCRCRFFYSICIFYINGQNVLRKGIVYRYMSLLPQDGAVLLFGGVDCFTSVLEDMMTNESCIALQYGVHIALHLIICI